MYKNEGANKMGVYYDPELDPPSIPVVDPI